MYIKKRNYSEKKKEMDQPEGGAAQVQIMDFRRVLIKDRTEVSMRLSTIED